MPPPGRGQQKGRTLVTAPDQTTQGMLERGVIQTLPERGDLTLILSAISLSPGVRNGSLEIRTHHYKRVVIQREVHRYARLASLQPTCLACHNRTALAILLKAD